MLLYVLVALFAPVIATHDPIEIDPVTRLAAPTAEHILGTDELGRDIFSRIVYATRVDLPLGFLGAFLPALLGVALGAMAGYYGGWVDSVIMRATSMGTASSSSAIAPASSIILASCTMRKASSAVLPCMEYVPKFWIDWGFSPRWAMTGIVAVAMASTVLARRRSTSTFTQSHPPLAMKSPALRIASSGQTW